MTTESIENITPETYDLMPDGSVLSDSGKGRNLFLKSAMLLVLPLLTSISISTEANSSPAELPYKSYITTVKKSPCIERCTVGINPKTGEIRMFPTTCLPDGWMAKPGIQPPCN